eukprot:9017702-Pyramimonas_sp.AAC.1
MEPSFAMIWEVSLAMPPKGTRGKGEQKSKVVGEGDYPERRESRTRECSGEDAVFHGVYHGRRAAQH